VDSADFGPCSEACARLPFRLFSGDPVAKGCCRKELTGRHPRHRRQAIARAVTGSKVCVAANPEPSSTEFCSTFSPPPEPGSTTQRQPHRCVIQRVQQAGTAWGGIRRGRCGNAVAKREMLWRGVENPVGTRKSGSCERLDSGGPCASRARLSGQLCRCPHEVLRGRRKFLYIRECSPQTSLARRSHRSCGPEHTPDDLGYQ
jgi:hypothetical protein